MRPIRRWAAALASLALSASPALAQPPLPGFVDHGSYTTVTSLGLDVYDVDAFYSTTYDEMLAQLGALGPGWRLATVAEVSPIYALLDEPSYLASARFLFGAASSSPDGITRYLTGGRVVDEPGSPDPAWGWVWGFGNGVQILDPAGPPTYGWSSYGIGADIKGVRFDGTGAWVVRTVPSTVPEPSTATLVAVGAVAALLAGRRRRGAA